MQLQSYLFKALYLHFHEKIHPSSPVRIERTSVALALHNDSIADCHMFTCNSYFTSHANRNLHKKDVQPQWGPDFTRRLSLAQRR